MIESITKSFIYAHFNVYTDEYIVCLFASFFVLISFTTDNLKYLFCVCLRLHWQLLGCQHCHREGEKDP